MRPKKSLLSCECFLQHLLRLRREFSADLSESERRRALREDPSEVTGERWCVVGGTCYNYKTKEKGGEGSTPHLSFWGEKKNSNEADETHC